MVARFRSGERDRLKLLVWEGDGFSIYYKCLESGGFQSPSSKNSAPMEIDVTQLSLILHGIDLQSAKRRKRYRSAG